MAQTSKTVKTPLHSAAPAAAREEKSRVVAKDTAEKSAPSSAKTPAQSATKTAKKSSVVAANVKGKTVGGDAEKVAPTRTTSTRTTTTREASKRSREYSPAANAKKAMRKVPDAPETTRVPFLELRRAGVEGRDINTAPSQWGRRLARLVGEKFGVQMDENLARNEGVWRRKNIAIKCAKSPMPPISVLHDMIEHLDFVWAVYVMQDGGAQIWSVGAADVTREGYLTRGLAGPRRIEIYLRKIARIGKLVGELSREEVESCQIP